MDPQFGYDAPQFLDFQKQEQEDTYRIESYFDCDHESPLPLEEFLTPMTTAESRRQSKSMLCLSDIGKCQKEIFDDDYEGNTTTLSDAMNELTLEPPDHHTHGDHYYVAHDSSTLRRASSTSRMAELSKPKGKCGKFVSMSEMLKKFEGTPDRFRKKDHAYPGHTYKHILNTIPHSPALATKGRSRAPTVLSAKEKEEQEIEQIHRYKIKANPINYKILAPLKSIPLAKKPVTQIEPFKITDMVKKKPIVEAKQKEPSKKGACEPQKLMRTVTQPFSFDVRQQIVLSKKKKQLEQMLAEEKKQREFRAQPPPKAVLSNPSIPVKMTSTAAENIKAMKEKQLQQQEEERKLREFHARPLPKAIYNNPAIPVKQMKRNFGSTESIKSMKSEDGNKPFKARPPTSLLRKPFIPKKANLPLTSICPFELSTSQRIEERRQFDQAFKAKEEELACLRRAQEEQARNFEIREARKLTEYKAQPIRKFKEIPYVPPKPVTLPKSPKFVSRENKENIGLE